MFHQSHICHSEMKVLKDLHVHTCILYYFVCIYTFYMDINSHMYATCAHARGVL